MQLEHTRVQRILYNNYLRDILLSYEGESHWVSKEKKSYADKVRTVFRYLAAEEFQNSVMVVGLVVFII